MLMRFPRPWTLPVRVLDRAGFARASALALIVLLTMTLGVGRGAGAANPPRMIDFVDQTLPNGLRVLYAPLHQAPVVEVRLFYHVGSRDERPDRQGFAHMFEHMMFRGSTHVAPQEHMKDLMAIGGQVNAFTSYDQTVYHETLPSSALETALYLEADRMAGFKVSDNIFGTERKVVAEEWRMRYMNQPYGRIFEDFQRAAFTTHSYRWTPIGNMDQLRAARSNELQDFFNTYYVPNNAILVLAGDLDVDAAKALVQKYFAWIPRGAGVPRDIPVEPRQTSPRHVEVAYRAPLPRVQIGYHLPGYRDEDHAALNLLGDILGSGESSRLQRLLVSSEHPLAVQAFAQDEALEDSGIFMVGAVVMQGKDSAAVETVLDNAVADVVAHGITQEELDKAKTMERVAVVHQREIAPDIAEQLGEATLMTGDPDRVNTDPARLEAVTLADIQRVAKKYLQPDSSTTLRVKPDPLGKEARAAATQAAMPANVVPPSRPIAPRAIVFPSDWPAHAPTPLVTAKAHLDKGTEQQIEGVRVIVLPDHRLPLVNFSLTTRHGSYEDPADKVGLSSLSDNMLSHGAADLTYEQLAEDLESRGISIDVSDGGDMTRVNGSCITPQLDHALMRAEQVVGQPTFPAEEFARLKAQVVGELQLSQENPTTVAGQDLNAALYGTSPLGRSATPLSVDRATLDDVKSAYRRNFSKTSAILVFSGDVTVEHGFELARQFLDAVKLSDLPPAPDIHETGVKPAKRRIILIDRPSGRQASVRIAIAAYDIRSEDKYAGSVAGQVLSGGGIDSRLMRYVRAEKGLAYGVHGVFQPTRHTGAFVAATETAIESTADAVEAIFKVLNDMKAADVTPEELNEARTRVAGTMLMSMQTIGQQASLRVDGILNDYPVDYYENYPARLAQVTAAEVRDVMNKYVDDARTTIVIVAPADQLKDQLSRLGDDVTVLPMPARRQNATSLPSGELLKPAK